MDIQSVDNRSLVKKLMQLCHIRAEFQVTGKKIPIDLDNDIGTGQREILRRLEAQVSLIPDLVNKEFLPQ